MVCLFRSPSGLVVGPPDRRRCGRRREDGTLRSTEESTSAAAAAAGNSCPACAASSATAAAPAGAERTRRSRSPGPEAEPKPKSRCSPVPSRRSATQHRVRAARRVAPRRVASLPPCSAPSSAPSLQHRVEQVHRARVCMCVCHHRPGLSKCSVIYSPFSVVIDENAISAVSVQ